METIQKLRDSLPANFPISIDTTLSEVAHQAIEHGANMINDVSAGRDDPQILELVGSTGVPLVLMRMWYRK